MNASEYRATYAAFSRDLEREHHRLYVAGHAEPYMSPELARIHDRYSDLHTREAVADLQKLFDATSAQFETERAGLARLVALARSMRVAQQARNVTDELHESLTHRKIRFEGEIKLRDVPLRLGDEARAAARRELSARWLDELPACDDLFLARQKVRNEAAEELGLESYASLKRAATINPASSDALPILAQNYLNLTARLYRQRLPSHLIRALPGEDTAHMTFAESLRFERSPHLDVVFPGSKIAETYEAALRTFNLNPARQQNLHLHARGESAPAGVPVAAAFAPDPPLEVRLEVYAGARGAAQYREFWIAVGRAQHLAWSSADLITRFPEFLYPSSDAAAAAGATRAGFAQLFASFLHDADWLAEHRALAPETAQRIARALGIVEVFRARRAAAGVIARDKLASDAGAMSSEQAVEYAALMSEATGFAHDPRLYAADIFGDRDPATELRAHLFAASLRDHLRTRYGSRWWKQKRARDEMIDLWSTGTRYTAEELIRLSAGATLDAEALAASHVELMREVEG